MTPTHFSEPKSDLPHHGLTGDMNVFPLFFVSGFDFETRLGITVFSNQSRRTSPYFELSRESVST